MTRNPNPNPIRPRRYVTLANLRAMIRERAAPQLSIKLHGTTITVLSKGEGQPLGWAVNDNPVTEKAMENVLADLQGFART